LYTGTGTIALFVADSAAKVIGIESVAAAIADAQQNAQFNNINNAHFIAGEVEKILDANFIARWGKPDTIITDPPRAGMHAKVLKMLLEMQPARIVYVSCNPTSQARDIAVLQQQYTVSKIQPVDMFPHTEHVESVACLQRI
jgi:23S rRNA (uracil1939-C5)-methyltransferase